MRHDDIIVNMRTARNMTGIMGFISLSLFYVIGFTSSSSESMMADIRIVMAQTITIITGIILLNLCAWFHRLHKIDWYGKPHWNLIPLLMANILIYALPFLGMYANGDGTKEWLHHHELPFWLTVIIIIACFIMYCITDGVRRWKYHHNIIDDSIPCWD